MKKRKTVPILIQILIILFLCLSTASILYADTPETRLETYAVFADNYSVFQELITPMVGEGGTIVADKKRNRFLVVATDKEHAAIKQIADKINIPPVNVRIDSVRNSPCKTDKPFRSAVRERIRILFQISCRYAPGRWNGKSIHYAHAVYSGTYETLSLSDASSTSPSSQQFFFQLIIAIDDPAYKFAFFHV